MDGRIFHLKKHISQNLSYHWTVAEFAKIANLSPPHLYKLFKANLGKSPMRYLQDLRLEKACELLTTTFLQMKQIGFETGLRSDSHFTRDFKRKYGVTPWKYRKQHWENVEFGTVSATKNSISQIRTIMGNKK